ncbi:hypothetical protein TSUD_85260 [Trifolium subterraneum]|uniref:Uncharacterized protein n=1 Tax=Trifolium subterraneum TaxID=3900 RepID=A0A2Z6NTK3_TRISU|nr:hypothetical protein TSUD_85260 [Trifolium subterraneum]
MGLPISLLCRQRWKIQAPQRSANYRAPLALMHSAPVHQMQQYYRLGALDNCSGKWKAMVDCLMLKTKPSSQVEVCSYFLLVNG